MRFSRMITVVGAHAEGELNEVITGGVLDVPGRTMFDKKRHLETHGDDLRRFLLFEPRGKVTQCVNLLLPSVHPEADAGFVIMESVDYPPMSGTNTICVATVLLETGLLPMREPVTTLTLEAPGGLVRVRATCRDGQVEAVRFVNVPSFAAALDRLVEVPGLGTVRMDVAYGGAFFGIVDARALGFALTPDEAADLVRVGETIKRAAAKQIPVVHPENPEIRGLTFTEFAGPWQGIGGVSRNAVVVSPGRLDRSPCGTGTSARLAVLHARWLVKPGEAFIHESIIGTRFTAECVDAVPVGGVPGVSTAITGRAWLTAFHHYVLDPTDPFPTGYRTTDTWPAE